MCHRHAAIPDAVRRVVADVREDFGHLKWALLDAFENVARPLFLKILQSTEESRMLAATRDLLLPKLMSGAIRVKDAAKIAEAAL